MSTTKVVWYADAVQGGVCLFIYFIVTPCADALVCICACVLCTCACARFVLRHSVHFKVIKVGSDAYKAAIIDVCWDTPEAKAPTVAMRLETVGDYEKDPIVEVRHYPTGIYLTCGPSVGGATSLPTTIPVPQIACSTVVAIYPMQFPTTLAAVIKYSRSSLPLPNGEFMRKSVASFAVPTTFMPTTVRNVPM